MNFDSIMKCDPNNKKIYSKIKELCLSNQLIPFVGAGLSMSIYPSWSNTLRELISTNSNNYINDVEALLSNNDFEGAADYIYAKLGKGAFENKFKEIFAKEKIYNVGLSNSLQLLPKVFSNAVVTTNYDKCLELSYKNSEYDFDSIITPQEERTLGNYLTQITRDKKHFLWKIHGDIDNFNNRVFTSDEYNNVYTKHESSIATFFQSNIFIFLGCSLSGSDCYMKLLLNLGENSAITNYALLKRPADNNEWESAKKRLSDHWIFPLWYPSEDEKHESISIILRKLIEDIDKSSYTSKSIAKTFNNNNVPICLSQILTKRGIQYSLPTNSDFVVDDIIALLTSKNPNHTKAGIEREIYQALGQIYDNKYLKLSLNDDIRGMDSEWKDRFYEILDKYDINNISQKKTVVIGVGNGSEGDYFEYESISKNGNLILVDIANESLNKVSDKYPNAICINQPAQDMSMIPTSSIDLYIATRVYQSTYFNVDRALYEAVRILKKNGIIILSVANGFLEKKKRTYIPGLLDIDGVKIDKEKPRKIINSIQTKLRRLEFESIVVSECKSEIYICARK